MEPAVGRREQFTALDALWENNGMPQWSPPLDGEHARMSYRYLASHVLPQWSPPMDSGSIPTPR
jgi:hypothetical protein